MSHRTASVDQLFKHLKSVKLVLLLPFWEGVGESLGWDALPHSQRRIVSCFDPAQQNVSFFLWDDEDSSDKQVRIREVRTGQYPSLPRLVVDALYSLVRFPATRGPIKRTRVNAFPLVRTLRKILICAF